MSKFNDDLDDLLRRVENTTRLMRVIFWLALAIVLVIAYPWIDRYLFEPVGDLLYFALK